MDWASLVILDHLASTAPKINIFEQKQTEGVHWRDFQADHGLTSGRGRREAQPRTKNKVYVPSVGRVTNEREGMCTNRVFQIVLVGGTWRFD